MPFGITPSSKTRNQRSELQSISRLHTGSTHSITTGRCRASCVNVVDNLLSQTVFFAWQPARAGNIMSSGETY
jgi:hypothetical protein